MIILISEDSVSLNRCPLSLRESAFLSFVLAPLSSCVPSQEDHGFRASQFSLFPGEVCDYVGISEDVDIVGYCLDFF